MNAPIANPEIDMLPSSHRQARIKLLNVRNMASANAGKASGDWCRQINGLAYHIANEVAFSEGANIAAISDAIHLCTELTVQQRNAGLLDGSYETDRYSA